MWSGSPRAQPSVKAGRSGRSAGSPRGAPASTHCAIVSISCSVSRASSLKVPKFGSGNQGGILRVTTLSLMARAHGRTSSYDRSGIGATSPGRWQLTQLSKRIGATSFVNVAGACAETSPVMPTTTAAVRTTTRAKRRCSMGLLLLSPEPWAMSPRALASWQRQRDQLARMIPGAHRDDDVLFPVEYVAHRQTTLVRRELEFQDDVSRLSYRTRGRIGPPMSRGSAKQARPLAELAVRSHISVLEGRI